MLYFVQEGRRGKERRKREEKGMVKMKENRIEKRMGQETVEGKGDRAKGRGNEWERERGNLLGKG